MKDFILIGFYFYLSLIFISIIYGILFFNNIQSIGKIILAYLAVTFASELCSFILSYTIKNSNPPYHIYIPLHYLLISLVYRNFLIRDKVYRLYFYLSLFVFICFSIINSMFFQTFNTLPSNSFLFCSILVLPQILLLFVKLIETPSNTALKKQSIFWFNCGNLLFHSTTFLIWGSFNLLLKNGSVPLFVHVILIVVNIIYYGCLLIALYTERKIIKAPQYILS